MISFNDYTIQNVIKDLESILGKEKVISNESKKDFGRDYNENIELEPWCVALPSSEDEVIEIMKYSFKKKVPVIPAGGLSNLSGQTLPIYGGIIISSSNLSKIEEISPDNGFAIVQPGVITSFFQNEIKKHSLYYPPDPASKDISTIGGNVATNAAGPRSFKYGPTRNFVLNIKVITSGGFTFWTSFNTLKKSSGYDLTHIFVGSEGTLGFFSKIVIKIIPLPYNCLLFLIPFSSVNELINKIIEILQKGIFPSALEMIEGEAWQLSASFLNLPCYISPLPPYLLLAELDDFSELKFQNVIHKISKLIPHNAILAESTQDQEKLWQIRNSIGKAVKNIAPYKEIDCSLPRKQIPLILEYLKEVQKEYNCKIYSYGHIGDGNIHINLLKNKNDAQINEISSKIYSKIFELGGAIAGEHGIGAFNAKYTKKFYNEKNYILQYSIKKILDPYNLVNPGKIFENEIST